MPRRRDRDAVRKGHECFAPASLVRLRRKGADAVCGSTRGPLSVVTCKKTTHRLTPRFRKRAGEDEDEDEG